MSLVLQLLKTPSFFPPPPPPPFQLRNSMYFLIPLVMSRKREPTPPRNQKLLWSQRSGSRTHCINTSIASFTASLLGCLSRGSNLPWFAPGLTHPVEIKWLWQNLFLSASHKVQWEHKAWRACLWSVLLYAAQESVVWNLTLPVTLLEIREPTQRACARVTASQWITGN